jgi:hypothetical protein
MRYTVVDERGAVSFIGPAHALKMLVAACAEMPADLTALLDRLRPLDARFAAAVGDGLAVFDEHHIAGPAGPAPAPEAPSAPLDRPAGHASGAVFRVTDAASRQASLRPHDAGVIVFNLVERRIVQLHNSYAEIRRRDRGRLRRDGRPVQTYYFYELPEEWRLVP